MAKKKLVLGVSPLTGTVYAGTTICSGTIWSNDKQDVTKEFINCILEKYAPKGDDKESSFMFEDINNNPIYKMTITKV